MDLRCARCGRELTEYVVIDGSFCCFACSRIINENNKRATVQNEILARVQSEYERQKTKAMADSAQAEKMQAEYSRQIAEAAEVQARAEEEMVEYSRLQVEAAEARAVAEKQKAEAAKFSAHQAYEQRQDNKRSLVFNNALDRMDKGDYESMAFVGLCYAIGDMVPQNMKLAKEYILEAYSKGSKKALAYHGTLWKIMDESEKSYVLNNWRKRTYPNMDDNFLGRLKIVLDESCKNWKPSASDIKNPTMALWNDFEKIATMGSEIGADDFNIDDYPSAWRIMNDKNRLFGLLSLGADQNNPPNILVDSILIQELTYNSNDNLLDIVLLLVFFGAELTCEQDDYFGYPLTAFLRFQKTKYPMDIIKLFIELDLFPVFKTGYTALHAAMDGTKTEFSKSIVKQLIEAGADINAEDGLCRTPLFIAVHSPENKYSTEVVKLLIEMGSDVNYQIESSWTNSFVTGGESVLSYAAQSFEIYDTEHIIEILKILIESGADVNSRDVEGKTALMHVARYCKKKNAKGAMKLLLDAGANPNIVGDDGTTALQLVLENGCPEMQEEFIGLLLGAGVDPNCMKDGQKVILHLYENGHTDSADRIVLWLLGAGANSAVIDETVKHNILFSLIKRDANETDFASLNLLIENGVDIEAKDNCDTPLLAVARSNFTKSASALVRKLVQAGADVNAKDDDGNTALLLVARNNFTEYAPEMIKELIRAGADVDAREKNGWTALMCVSHNNYTEYASIIIRELAHAKANINALTQKGNTALMFVASYNFSDNSLAVIRELIQAGADTNIARQGDGWTALMFVARYNFSEYAPSIIRCLVQAGADVNARSYKKWTALMLAVQNNKGPFSESTIVSLLDMGADKKLKNSNGDSSEMIANRYQDRRIATILKNASSVHKIGFLAKLFKRS